MEENNQAIQSWVAQARAAGLSDEQIATQLRTTGWPEDQIAQLFPSSAPEKVRPALPMEDLVSLAKDAQHIHPLGNQPTQKSWIFRHLGISIGVLAGVLVLGGVVFAELRGFIPLPFMGNNAALLSQALQKLESVESGEFGVTFAIASEPRAPGTIPLPKGTSEDVDGLLPADFTDGISADFNLNGAFTAFMSTDTTDFQKIRGVMTAKGAYQSSGTSYSADLEARITAGQAYLFIKQFPSIPFLDLSSMTGKWIALNKPGDSTVTDFLGSAIPKDTNVEQDSQKLKTEAGALFRIALDTKALEMKGGGSERVDGHATKKVILTTNPDQWMTMLQAYKADAIKRGVPTDFTDDMLKEMEKPGTLTALRTLTHDLKVTVWVDSSDSTPRKAEMSIIIVPDETATNFKDRQMHFTLGFTLDHVNEQPNVEVPKDAVTLESVIGPIMGGDTNDDQGAENATTRNEWRESDLGQLRTGLALFFDDNLSYPKTLDALVVKPKYVSQLPTPPNPGETYTYTPAKDGKQYELCAEFEGTEMKTAGQYCYYSETPGSLIVKRIGAPVGTSTNTSDIFSNPAQKNTKRFNDLYKLREAILQFQTNENRVPTSYSELLSYKPPLLWDVTPIAGELYTYTLLDAVNNDFSVCAAFEDTKLYEGSADAAGQYCLESAKPNAFIKKGVNGGIDIENTGDIKVPGIL